MTTLEMIMTPNMTLKVYAARECELCHGKGGFVERTDEGDIIFSIFIDCDRCAEEAVSALPYDDYCEWVDSGEKLVLYAFDTVHKDGVIAPPLLRRLQEILQLAETASDYDMQNLAEEVFDYLPILLRSYARLTEK